MLIEVCLDSVASTRVAIDARADRVELCAGLTEGGTTPSKGLITRVIAALSGTSTKLAVLIRPRAGDFCYSDDDLAVMHADIAVRHVHQCNVVLIVCRCARISAWTLSCSAA